MQHCMEALESQRCKSLSLIVDASPKARMDVPCVRKITKHPIPVNKLPYIRQGMAPCCGCGFQALCMVPATTTGPNAFDRAFGREDE